MKDQIALTIKAPVELLAEDGTVKVAGKVPSTRTEAYNGALLREVVSAAGDAKDGNVEFVVFDGCSSANMTLASWCKLVETIQAEYSGVNTARMLFCVPPELVNAKTVSYAFRFRCCFNICMANLSEAKLCELDRVGQTMRGERFVDYGVEVEGSVLSCRDNLGTVLERLKSNGVLYVKVAGDAGLDEKVKGQLCAAGFLETRLGVYTGSPKFAAWFDRSRVTASMGFGLGARSEYAGERFTCTDDVETYIAQAGLSMDIYRGEK